ncbi:MAG: stage V sporulation protein AD [Candidatus Pristimantibacillus lignocellulolyticus]|uniref:Stage V sporulation protein AD n=1 Tax=Candidatus Pristimantibacillus lignocellulolyticus TaxID=2994561 RepID=A0A9J6ZAJ4_9BACL|nr:MAG: stage V sporulation protein AD [Candidatus Pristimantibacillus lignocellulolyticus]
MLRGQQSWWFEKAPKIISTATIVGPLEGLGPLADTFDVIHPELDMNEKTWEKAERLMLNQATQKALSKANLDSSDLQIYVGGDLLNQIITNSFVARELAIPYLGVFGACSTSMESLAIVAQLVSSGAVKYGMAATSSHNATAEKQFRYPTEYGAQKPPTAQNTITGSGAAIVSLQGKGPIIEAATIGKVIDLGITDPFNMGAAMAPAAVDTIIAHFNDLNRSPLDYDLIITGDLASVGHPIAKELLLKEGVPINQTSFDDCGLRIYDIEQQDVQAGGSGAGCSAVITYGQIIQQLTEGKLKRVLVVATGALMSPISFQQGDTIPCIAHAVALKGMGVE